MFVFRIIKFCGTRRGVRNIFIMINMDIVVPRSLVDACNMYACQGYPGLEGTVMQFG